MFFKTLTIPGDGQFLPCMSSFKGLCKYAVLFFSRRSSLTESNLGNGIVLPIPRVVIGNMTLPATSTPMAISKANMKADSDNVLQNTLPASSYLLFISDKVLFIAYLSVLF